LHGSLRPPLVISKAVPRFSPEAATRGRGGIIVVFGLIGVAGKFEELRIMQSPDESLNHFLIDSLKLWTFQPAEIDGTKVALKVLLGVPVDSVPRD